VPIAWLHVLIMTATPASSVTNQSHDQEHDVTKHHDQPKQHCLSRNVDPFLTSIPVILCCFTSGLVDSAAFNAWGVFASMQTGMFISYPPHKWPNAKTNLPGNTIILALGASGQPYGHPLAWLQALVAIVFFIIGAFVTARVSRWLGPVRRSTLALSFFIQCVLITTAVALIQGGVVPGILRDGGEYYIQLIPLPMLSFQAGQQSVAARHLGLNEIPTTVLTSIYCDIGNDPNLFQPFTANWQRNRRVLAVTALLIGAIVGGWLSRTRGGMEAPLWMAAAIKFVLTVAWLAWKPEKAPTEEKV
jgi:uncharacterized membrane protein YoaK (UPF0700 family)